MKHLWILLSILTLSSCANFYLKSPTTKSTEISRVDYLTPLSYIYLIKKGNNAEPSDSLSMITTENLILLLDKNKDSIRLGHEIPFTNDSVKAKVEVELAQLIDSIALQRKIVGISLPPTIDSILTDSDERFVLATMAFGFQRKKGNYVGQVAKAFVVGVLTLGIYVPNPNTSNLTLIAFIFDAEKKEIAYYTRSAPVEKKPTNTKVLDKQLTKLFNGYLYDLK